MSSKLKSVNTVPVNFYKDGELNLVDLSLSGNTISFKKNNSKKTSSLYLIPALVDLKSYLGEPGNDLAETLESLISAAEKGGFKHVLVHSNEYRILKNKEDIQFVNASGQVMLQAVGSATKKLDLEEMADLFEMYQAGSKVIAFPGIKAASSGITQRTQQYLNNFNGILVVNPYDSDIRSEAMVAETPVTTSLGFSGAPDMAEYSIVERDIAIATYNCAPIHFSGITTKESVDVIAKAKIKGINVTCDVSIASLCFTDENIEGYDSNFKLNPFLRDKIHQKALFKGLKEGTIDAIASYHQPQIIEDKKCEFGFAKYGITSLQTYLSLDIEHIIPQIGWEKFISCASLNPEKISGNTCGNKYILIDTEETCTLNEKTNQSLSKNSPVWGQQLHGKVLGMYKL